MTDTSSRPVDGAPFTSRSLAHLVLAVKARDVAEWARQMVPNGPRPEHIYGGSLVSDSVALVAKAQEVLAAAVLLERDDGTDWSVLAGELGVEVEDVLARWGGPYAEWALSQPAGPVDAAESDAAIVAQLADLDAWSVRHQEPDDLPGGPCPVSSVMQRQGALLELVHLQGLARWATERYGPASAEALAVLRRRAVVFEALADRADSDQDAEEHRAQARAALDEATARMQGVWPGPGR